LVSTSLNQLSDRELSEVETRTPQVFSFSEITLAEASFHCASFSGGWMRLRLCCNGMKIQPFSIGILRPDSRLKTIFALGSLSLERRSNSIQFIASIVNLFPVLFMTIRGYSNVSTPQIKIDTPSTYLNLLTFIGF
jgi:hypothetical protein